MTNTKGIENLKELEKLETEQKKQKIKRTEREKLEKIVKVKIKKVKELKTLEIQKLELERQLLNEKEQIDIATEIGNITKKSIRYYKINNSTIFLKCPCQLIKQGKEKKKSPKSV